MKKIIIIFFVLSLSLPTYLLSDLKFFVPKAEAADFNPSNLISDGEFINTSSMNVNEIQDFLSGKNSTLKDFSENGRSAAQIIYDAAHGYGDAAGSYSSININSSTGTINPKAILVTLQKEQSLVTNNYYDRDRALLKAMGFACPEGNAVGDYNGNGCTDAYEGFTRQVENAAWQFRYNYEYALGRAVNPPRSHYKVGDTVACDEDRCGNSYNVTIGNAATASLYSYTPHVYNGNYNFWNNYINWFGVDLYSYTYVSSSSFPTLNLGEATTLSLTVKNTGSQTWLKSKVRLATNRPQDRVSPFLRGSGWLSENRVVMQQSSVAPGQNATFSFQLTAPSNIASGVYKEYFRLVADGITWMPDRGIYWDVTVR